MTTFDEREKSYERKFQQDQELAFKVHARRNKLLGEWAAHELGLAGKPAQDYAANVVAEGLKHGGEKAILAALATDFAAKGVKHDHQRLQLEMQRLEREAKQQLGKAG